MIYPLYKKYLLKKTLKLCFFILLCFFLLYSIIDYSLHSQEFLKAKGLLWTDIFIYYAATFVKRLDLSLPFALLLSSISVLLSLGKHFEIIALQAGGLSKKALLRPFFQVAIIFSTLIILNFELVLPKSLNYIDNFEKNYYKKTRLEPSKKAAVHHYELEDSSLLIYTNYDSKTNELFDLFYYISIDHIWKIKKLKLSDGFALAHYAQEFQRDTLGNLNKTGDYPQRIFDTLPKKLSLGISIKDNIESQSLSKLFKPNNLHFNPVEKINRLKLTQLLFKLMISLLPILCVLSSAPFCLEFKRNVLPFKIYSIFLISFIFFFTLVDTCVIISETSRFSPWLVLLSPFIIIFSTFSWIYLKKCYYPK